MKVDAVILAAGTGSRMKAGYNKVFMKLLGKEILLHTLETFEKSDVIRNIILVTGKDDIQRCSELTQHITKLKDIICGGKERQESSYLGVSASDAEFVMIHDAARALISEEDIYKLSVDVKKYGTACVGTPCVDTMKRCINGEITGTVDRECLYKIYTPQCFLRTHILKLHEKAQAAGISVTDDAALCERFGETVHMVEGDPYNIKITTIEDICIAEAILSIKQQQ